VYDLVLLVYYQHLMGDFSNRVQDYRRRLGLCVLLEQVRLGICLGLRRSSKLHFGLELVVVCLLVEHLGGKEHLVMLVAMVLGLVLGLRRLALKHTIDLLGLVDYQMC
jgi:hypothetical protein